MGIFLFFIIALELSSRLFIPPPLNAYNFLRRSYNSTLEYELKPKTKTIFRGTYIKIPPTIIEISKDGLRDKNYSIIKQAENTFRIVILGDSVAFGWGVDLEDTFAKKLEAKLNHSYPLRQYEVINFSVPGYNLVQKLESLKEKALRYAPNVVIINISPDDFCKGYHYQPSKSLSYRLSKISYLYRSLSTRLILNKADKAAVGYIPHKGIKDSLVFFSEIDDLSTDKNFKVIMAFDKVKPWMNELLKKCREHNFIILDYSHIYKKPNTRIKGENHPNDLGHSYIAEELYKSLVGNNLL